MQSIIDWVANFQLNSFLGISLYWFPVFVCAVGYTLRTIQNYLKDKYKREWGNIRKDRDHWSHLASTVYQPTDTIGTLIGRALVTIIPVANIWAAAFDISPKFFSKFFQFLGDLFDQPLVPDSNKHKSIREVNKNKLELESSEKFTDIGTDELVVDMDDHIANLLIEVGAEIVRANQLHPQINSMHEAYSVIYEELDEFWDEVRKKSENRNKADAKKELIQTAAMCIRAIDNLDL